MSVITPRRERLQSNAGGMRCAFSPLRLLSRDHPAAAGNNTTTLLLITSKLARSSAAMTMRPESAGSALMRPRSATGASWSIGEARSRSGGRSGLAILSHHLQAQLDRLARTRLRLFQGFAIGNHRGSLGQVTVNPKRQR
jgi:hypothetical protein